MADVIVQGVVKWAGDEKKFGNYSFNMEDRDDWFRSKNRCADVIQPGNLIKVKVKKNKRGDFELAAAPKLVSANAGGSSSSGSNSGSTGGTYVDRQTSIVMQHSQDAARETVALLVANGGIKLAATKTEANKTILLDLLDELTAKFYAAAIDPASVIGERAEVEAEEAEEEADEDEVTEESGDDVTWD